MKNKKIKGLACVLTCALLLPACKKPVADVPVGLSDVTVWGMPGTEKVYEDIEQGSAYYAKYKTSPAINLKMAKGEYEGGQIIVSASKDATFDFISADLVCGDNKISKENVEILVQKYITVQVNYDGASNLPAAKYPDALVPMENIKNVGENVVYKGENQGFYIRVKTAIDQPTGTYTGNLTLKIGDESQSIPVSVKVEDVTVSEENHLQSAFLNGWSFFEGELDTSQEMFDAYNDALLKYRLCSNNLMDSSNHMEDISTPEKVKEWVEKAYEYMQNPMCSTVNMPYQMVGKNLNQNKMTEMLQAIWDYSVEKNYNMFKKLIWYGGVIDEPRGNGIMEMAYNVSMQFYTTKNEFADRISVMAKDVPEDLKADMVQDIRDLANILTEYYDEKLASAGVTFCPLFQYYNSESLRDDYEGLGDRWWYGCVQPKAPYPTYHIDDTWLSARVLSWMQAEYNVVGNLYWATDLYSRYDPSKGYQSIDEYYEGVATRLNGANGEGFLFYPGKKYGVTGPLGSMRLEAIRDGMEEYEILYEIKQRFAKINETLSKDNQLNFSSFVTSLTKNMYSGTVVTTNTEEFSAAREKLFETAKLSAATEYGVIKNEDDGYGNHTLKFVTHKNWAVKNNGANLTAITQEGDYAVYEIVTPLKESANSLKLSFTKENESIDYTIDLGGKAIVRYGNSLDLTAFEKGTVLPTFTVSGTGVKVSIPATTRVDVGEQEFSMVGKNLSFLNTNTQKIVLHIRYNGTDKPILHINAKFAGSRVNSEITSMELANGNNMIVVDLSTRDMDVSGLLEKLIFSFYKAEDEKLMPSREFTIKAIVFYE